MRKPTAPLLVVLMVVGFVMLHVGAAVGLGIHAWYIGDMLAVVGMVLSFLALLAWVHWYFDAMTRALTNWVLAHTVERWFNKNQ